MIGLIVFLAALSSLLAITMFTMVRTNQKDKLDIIEILLGIDNLKEELEQNFDGVQFVFLIHPDHGVNRYS